MGARGGFDGDLPSPAAISTFMKSGHGRRERELGILAEESMGLADFGEGGFFGFVGNRETGEMGEWGEMLAAAFFEEIVGESGEISSESGFDDGMIGLKSLEDDIGNVEMSATNAADNLGEQLKSAFLGGEIRQGETGIGLNNADGGEMGEIEAASESLSADEDVDFARFMLSGSSFLKSSWFVSF